MPELPDVEARRAVLERALHARVETVHVSDAGRVLDVAPSTLRRHVEGDAFDRTRRHGKWLFGHLARDGRWLALHFGMTGDLVRARDGLPNHARVVLDLDDGSRLAFSNQRKLGKVSLTDSPEAFVKEHGLGPDALDVDEDDFVSRVREKRTTVKAALMDQSLVAGVGNVWADEILFHAKLRPDARVPDLSEADVRRVFRKMRHVLALGVERDARVEDLPDSWLLPRREEGAACPRGCGGTVTKSRVAGRGTYACPSCQRGA